MKTVLVTGGCGFIGSAVVRFLIAGTDWTVVNLDRLTYAGHRCSLGAANENPRYHFVHGDICDRPLVRETLAKYRPEALLHLAAESHVDRSISGPAEFIRTNVVGTCTLLEAACEYWNRLSGPAKDGFRFHHVSTDEVFGALGPEGSFNEETPYDPRSPYSASKAGSDHLVRAWHHTYGLPTFITNCSNNYGPYQFPEKLIPVVIRSAVQEKSIPVYGHGLNVRDWLYVDDHVRALKAVLERGTPGETYCIGGRAEVTNLDLVRILCDILDGLRPRSNGVPYRELITFVTDRPGHDFRYSIDCSKLEHQLSWKPEVTLAAGMRHTVEWYLANGDWVDAVLAPADRGNPR